MIRNEGFIYHFRECKSASPESPIFSFFFFFFFFFFSVCLCICFRINGTDCCTFPFILGIRYAAHRFMSTLYICHIQLIMLSTISPQKKGHISIFVKL
jgi:hypothetical protein